MEDNKQDGFDFFGPWGGGSGHSMGGVDRKLRVSDYRDVYDDEEGQMPHSDRIEAERDEGAKLPVINESDYYFEMELNASGNDTAFHFVSRDYYNQYGYVDEQLSEHISAVAGLERSIDFPNLTEISESVWCDKMVAPKDIRKELLRRGFVEKKGLRLFG